MFTYKDLPDDRVSLEMDKKDYLELLMVLGFAVGKSQGRMRAIVDFVNRLNRTNPNFTQYELPPESVPETKH